MRLLALVFIASLLPASALAQPPAARDPGAAPEVELCELRKATISDVLHLSLKELDWDGEYSDLRKGRDCALRRSDHMATQFKGACALNISKGLETEDAALERVIAATLFECNDFPISMRDEFVPRDPGLR